MGRTGVSGGTSTADWRYTGFYFKNDSDSLDLIGMDAVRPIILMFKYRFDMMLFFFCVL